MDEKRGLCLFAWSMLLRSVACSHVFFHEPSAILVKPEGMISSHSDFGFALGHWNESLVVSSPRSNLIGEVYRCPLVGIFNNSLSCSGLNMFNSTTYTNDINPNQNFFLGASIAATNDFLFTCAPLVTKHIRRNNEEEIYSDSYGSCFVYANDTSIENQGPEFTFIAGTQTNKDRIEGGTGWTTLADETNGFLIVAKTSVFGDIKYLDISDPVKRPQTLTDTEMNSLGDDIMDVGYGITTGKFFSDETVYAFSKQSMSMTGQIVFLEKVERRRRRSKIKKKLQLMSDGYGPYMIENEVVGSMFGYALGAADLTSDGLSELLVGAPLQSEDAMEVEFGALHIYLGGDIDGLNDGSRMRTIFGARNMSRFGSAIATNDVDGDSIPEVFVSAPYEDSGVVYILSGYELKNKLLRGSSLTMKVSKLQHSQRVTRGDMTTLGFSLLTIPDMDGNGCDELAIGAPDAASAILLKSFQTITVIVTSELMGTIVREKDDNCTVRVCLHIDYSTKANNISGFLSVKNNVNGYAAVRNSSYKVDLSQRNESFCDDLLVDFMRHETFDYTLKTKVELENTKTLESRDFDASWVQLSTYSKTDAEVKFLRRCDGSDCNPDLSLDIKWNHTESTSGFKSKTTKKETYGNYVYEVGSSKEETISIVVRNKGFEASEACAWVEITGAPVHKPGKCSPQPPDNPRGYECTLPTSFRRNEEFTFDIYLNMSSLSNFYKALVVTARPHENCYGKNNNQSRDKRLEAKYKFEQAWQKVYLEGIKHDLTITDIEISEEESSKNDENEDKTENKFKNYQQYRITNNGSVTWNRSVAVIEVENRPFITKVGSTANNCTILEDQYKYTITCPLALSSTGVTTVIAWAEMSRKVVGENLNKGQQINVTSQMKIFMDSPTSEFIQKSLVTDIMMKKDKLFKNNQMLIGLIAAVLALLLLALVTYCLCKNGFFKREEKKKLNVLRESVRRHSIRIASVKSSRPSQKSPSNIDEVSDIDIEVVDDCPFEEIPISSKDDVVLVKAEAEVHHDKNDTKGNEEHEKKA